MSLFAQNNGSVRSGGLHTRCSCCACGFSDVLSVVCDEVTCGVLSGQTRSSHKNNIKMALVQLCAAGVAPQYLSLHDGDVHTLAYMFAAEEHVLQLHVGTHPAADSSTSTLLSHRYDRTSSSSSLSYLYISRFPSFPSLSDF